MADCLVITERLIPGGGSSPVVYNLPEPCYVRRVCFLGFSRLSRCAIIARPRASRLPPRPAHVSEI